MNIEFYGSLWFLNSVNLIRINVALENLNKRKNIFQLEVLKNQNEMLRAIPKEILPKDYGGDEPPLCELRGTFFI